jgi:hypothetical protein
MKVTTELLDELSKKASPGPWTRSHYIIYANGYGDGALVGLTSDVKYLCHTTDPTKAGDNARFITALVNEYRAGRLVLRS